MSDTYLILIYTSLLFLVCLCFKLTADYYSKADCADGRRAKNTENFGDNYYELNWVSPTLTNDVNYDRVVLASAACDSGIRKITNDYKARCTYSMSCDLTDDSSNPKCFAGYDMPVNFQNSTI